MSETAHSKKEGSHGMSYNMQMIARIAKGRRNKIRPL